MSTITVINPATGQADAHWDYSTDAQITDALDRADSAYREWRTWSLAARTQVLRDFAALVEERREEIAEVISREMGKRFADAKGELQYAIDIPLYYADNAGEFLADEARESNTGGRAVVRKFSTGVILGVMPWNYPYYQVVRFAIPNLAAGNTVIVKHASQNPESAELIEKLFLEAGLPDGAYINLRPSHAQVETIIADPRVQGVSVTGSEAAGSAIAATAGKHLKKVLLELGGSDPYLVLDTDDMASVAFHCAKARISNSGQSCNGGKRFIVLDALYGDFVEQFTEQLTAFTPGDPFAEDAGFGPLSSAAAAQELAEQVEDATSKGATLRQGETSDGQGAFFPASVLTDVTPEMRAYSEELFGPVAVVHRARDIAHAVDLANESRFGLGAAVFHRDLAVAEEVANRLEVGMVWVNEREGGGPMLPFGGVKASGFGRELGPDGIGEFINRKLIHLPA